MYTFLFHFAEGVRAALGERFRHGLVKTVQVETKGEKTDKKILVSCQTLNYRPDFNYQILIFFSFQKLHRYVHCYCIVHVFALRRGIVRFPHLSSESRSENPAQISAVEVIATTIYTAQ